MSISTIPASGFTKVLIGTDTSETAVSTQVNGVNIAAALEIQSTDGAFTPPRMTGAQMNALTPIVPGMQVYVTESATVPAGMYIRGSGTWNIVANSGDEDNVTVEQSDPKSFTSVPIWKTEGASELESTNITINSGNIFNGLYTLNTTPGNDQFPNDLPDGAPIYGMSFTRGDSTEGIGTDEVGTMTLWAGGSIQAEVLDNGNGHNVLTLSGSEINDPLIIGARGADAQINIELNSHGDGSYVSINNDDVSTVNFLQFYPKATGNGPIISTAGSDESIDLNLETTGGGSLFFKTTSTISDTYVNYLGFKNATTGNPVEINALGSDSHVSLSLVSTGNINLVAQGNIQAQISSFGGDGTNYCTLLGGSSGAPVTFLADGDGTDSNISMQLAVTGDGFIGANTLNGSRVNFGIGVTDFSSVNSSSSNNLYIANGAPPSAGVANTIQLYSSDLTAGNTTLCLRTEGTPVSSSVSVTATQNIAIKVNGTTYYLMAKTIV